MKHKVSRIYIPMPDQESCLVLILDIPPHNTIQGQLDGTAHRLEVWARVLRELAAKEQGK